MNTLREVRRKLPGSIKVPMNFYQGLSVSERVSVDNVLVYQRTTRTDLRQALLENRMHHRYVLAFVVDEPGDVFLDGAALALKEGEALLIMPYQYHDYYEIAEENLRWLFVTFEVTRGGVFFRIFATA